jgi:hypothetical protein
MPLGLAAVDDVGNASTAITPASGTSSAAS